MINTRDYANSIINSLENVLDENDIKIPDQYREGDEDEAAIFGETYDRLLTEIENILVQMLEEAKTYGTADYVMGIW